MIKQAITDQEILDCFDVMSQLRTHLVKGLFLSTIRSMANDGYKLVFVQNHSKVVAVAGYRIYTNLFMGKNFYVDDLVTAENERSRGVGEALINWLRDIAIKSNCQHFHLDSGTQRDQAHKFYIKQGFKIASYHFDQELNVKEPKA